METELRGWLEDRWNEAYGQSGEKLVFERFERLSKGQSSDLIDIAVRRGARTAEYVVRIEPRARQLFLKPDVVREARTLQGFESYPDLPAPKICWIEPGAGLVGAPFFVMERIEGRAPLGRPSMHLAGFLPELTVESRTTLWTSAMAALVAVHAVDWRRTHAFLAPTDLSEGFLGAHLRQQKTWYDWTTQGRKFPITDAAMDYLRANRTRVEDAEPVLVWNDARVGNMLFGADNRVAAVIDWEGPTIGPAGIDLGYWMMMDEFHAEAIEVARLPGWPGAAETQKRYEALSGRRIDDIDYFIVLAAMFISTTLIRQADIGVQEGRLSADTTMAHANSTTQMIARRLGLTVPDLSPDFAAHRQLNPKV